MLKRVLRPPYHWLQRRIYSTQFVFMRGMLTGHFYSPIPKIQEVKEPGPLPRSLDPIVLDDEAQLNLLRSWLPFYREQPWHASEATPDRKFVFGNGSFQWGDALMLYCTIRHLKPKRIVEVGSGFSSLVMLDTNRLFFGDSIECTFIEPYPQQMLLGVSRLIPKRVQEVPLETFSRLEAGDILFIDSSHVSKIGSDVNHLFFNVLPILPSGVFVHFHDIFYPFEYPVEWIRQGMAWNEAYMLRAFLQFNPAFRIELWLSYLIQFHREFIEKNMPLVMNDSGVSIWLRRL